MYMCVCAYGGGAEMGLSRSIYPSQLSTLIPQAHKARTNYDTVISVYSFCTTILHNYGKAKA